MSGGRWWLAGTAAVVALLSVVEEGPERAGVPLAELSLHLGRPPGQVFDALRSPRVRPLLCPKDTDRPQRHHTQSADLSAAVADPVDAGAVRPAALGGGETLQGQPRNRTARLCRR